MTDDLSDYGAEIRSLKRRIRALENGTPLENSSVTDGRLRFIGGTLRVDSGGRVEIVGTLEVEGTSEFIGPVTITGDTTVDGDWSLNGDGDITGDVDLTGVMTVGSGTSQIEIDGTTGEITAGILSIRPTVSGGSVVFDNGGRVTGGGNGVTVAQNASGTPAVFVGQDLTGDPGVSLRGAVYMDNLTNLPSSVTARYVVLGDDYRLYVTSGVGGGGGGTPGPVAGEFMWPFDPSTTDPVLGMYGMRLNPVTGIWAMHWGRDFSVPGGSPIPAIGDGTVVAVTSGDARGNRVRIDHGGGVYSEYFHMQSPSPLAVSTPVSRGDIIGLVGTTGQSTGNHLHLQIEQGGGWVDPTAFFDAQN